MFLVYFRTKKETLLNGASGKKPERGAEETDRYVTLEGALACLIEDYSVMGIQAERDQPRLF